MSEEFDRRIRRQLQDLRARGLERRCPLPSARQGLSYELDGRPVVGFCSNDYLGLAATSPSTSRADARTRTGASASPLICGDSPEHRALERELAALAGCEDAVLFSSGYALNVGVLPALIQRGDRVYSDALNHASIIDGLRLAASRPTILPHGHAPPGCVRPDAAGACWWVSEAIYSMDGDTCPIEPIQTFLDRGGLLYLDEAHSMGLFAGGGGFARAHALRPTIVLGTLGKAFGCAGAFAAGSRAVTSWIRARARSYVFSTGVSPLLIRALGRAVALVTGPEGDRRRARLWAHVARVAAALGVDALASPIVPVHIGDNQRALAVSHALLERGWHVQAIRPPTVREGSARLRVTLSSEHSVDQIDGLLLDLRDVLSHHDLPLVRSPAPPRRRAS